MFGLPLWAIQLIIVILKETGAVGWAGRLSLKTIAVTEDSLPKLKTYHEESDFPKPAGVRN